MTQKLTMKFLSGELDSLRGRLQDLELELERKLEKSLGKAAEKLKSHIESAQERPRASARQMAGIDTEARQRLIAETAYLIAERREFSEGNPEQDWLDAEKEVDHMLLQVVTLADAPKQAATSPATGKDNRL